MTDDARFEDAGEAPLRLMAQDSDDLKVVSALLQDAVFPVSEIRYDRGRRQLALLVNRFRWEDRAGRARSAGPERVRTLVLVRDVLGVASQGFDRGDADLVLSLLSVGFHPAEAPAGEVEFLLAGDGAVRARVECLDIAVSDVTRPYHAPSGKRPQHPD